MGRGFESRRDHEKAGKNDNKLPAFFFTKKIGYHGKANFLENKFSKKTKKHVLRQHHALFVSQDSMNGDSEFYHKTFLRQVYMKGQRSFM